MAWPSTEQLSFRGALLQVCSDMGEETWQRFCFLFSVPESAREIGRSGVLNHLVESGAVSSESPGEFAELLRRSLGRHNLALKFLGKAEHNIYFHYDY